MTSRERVLRALHYQEPGWVPIDLGVSIMSGLMAQILLKLKPRQ